MPEYNVSPDALKEMKPTEALTKLLLSAQNDHRMCVEKAMSDEVDPVDRCALTWGAVHTRYRQWAAYRAPFQTQELTAKWSKKWSKTAIEQWEKKKESSLVTMLD